MNHYYHAATRSFLDTATYRSADIPGDAVEITLERKKQLLEGERMGRVIVINDKGVPVLEELEPDPEAAARQERYWRDSEIQRITWLRDRHRDELDISLETTITADEFNELLAYMQALRDWPASSEFPNPSGRPIPPEIAPHL